MTLFKDKYRIESARRKGWDYTTCGAYFVTICTNDRNEYFGTVQKNKFKLNEMRLVAQKIRRAIPWHYPDVVLDEWVVMPNHIHGILFLGKNEKRPESHDRFQIVRSNVRRDWINPVSTQTKKREKIKILSKLANRIIEIPQIMGTGSLGTNVRWFKGRTTYEIRKTVQGEFRWQAKYHDRIIRDENELNRIRQYIKDNPINWEYDRNNMEYEKYSIYL